MSSSPTGPTSTTGSSGNSGSEAVPVVTCGALAGHIRDIAARRGWPVDVHALPARLHNRPEQIPGQVAAELPSAMTSPATDAEHAHPLAPPVLQDPARAGGFAALMEQRNRQRITFSGAAMTPAQSGVEPVAGSSAGGVTVEGAGVGEAAVSGAAVSGVVVAYADCGTYGKLDELCAERGIRRLPGLHCYDLYAGADTVRELFHMEPGTYLLTDYLVRTFDRTVVASLGLDRYPELWPDYFGHYTRVVWLAQERSPELAAEAERIAGRFGLPLTIIATGLGRLEAALASLFEGES